MLKRARFILLFILATSSHAIAQQFVLTLPDFYFPLAAPATTFDMTEGIVIEGRYYPVKQIKGVTYTEKRVYQPNCMVGVTCFPWGGKWRTETQAIHQYEKAVIVSADRQKVIFELPLEKDDAFALEHINVGFSLTQFGFPENWTGIRIPLAVPLKEGKSHYFKDSSGRNVTLNKEIYTGAGIIVRLDMLDNGQPSPTPIIASDTTDDTVLSDAERKALFSSLAFGNTDLKLIPLIIPASLPNWHGVERTEGKFVHSPPFDTISLRGDLLYSGYSQAYEKVEVWTRHHGKLISIVSDPHNYDPWGECAFKYTITFFPDGSEERYFIPQPVAGQEKNILIKGKDLSAITAFEQNSITLTPRSGAVHSDKQIAQCRRSIADARRMLTAPKAKLEQEFNAYQQLISQQSAR